MKRKSCIKTITLDKCRHLSVIGHCQIGYINPPAIKEWINPVIQGLVRPCPFTVNGQKIIGYAHKHLDKLAQL